ncbi:MAG TPA: hypothetical protein VFL14_12455 [Xanthomonadales bacterium]|nr:hypothetical protein [Xanthomonadales bacterium]
MCALTSVRGRFVGLVLGCVAACPPASAIDVVLRIGDPAPQIGTAGYTIESFVEPPSMSTGDFDTFTVFHVTIAGPGVTPNTSHVIYRWDRSSGVVRVARGGDVVTFDGNEQRILTILESPIVNDQGWVAYTTQLDDFRRGMVVWQPSAPPLGVAKVGQPIELPCETVAGNACNPPLVAGTLGTMATFDARAGAAFGSFYSLVLNGDVNQVVFRGAVQAPGFGTPDAVLLRQILPDGTSFGVKVVANSLMRADGAASGFFDDFTHLAMCRGGVVAGLATISQGAPYAIYRYDLGGVNHQLVARSYAPDATQRRDFHCLFEHVGYVGGVSSVALDGDATKKGVWIADLATLLHTQVYRNTATTVAIPAGATLGVPYGQAQAATVDDVGSVFATNIIGSTANGKAGVFRSIGGQLATLLFEEPPTLPGSVDTIWTAHVTLGGEVVFHVRRADQGQSILVRRDDGSLTEPLRTGQSIAVAPGDVRTIDSFWALGGAFGADPVVTGDGTDGIQGAVSPFGEVALVVYYGATTGNPGSAIITAPVIPPQVLFADGFEG